MAVIIDGTNASTFPTATVAGVLEGASVTQGGVATSRMFLGTAQNTTSGTSIDFTGIPSWVKRITVMFDGVSTNGSSHPLVQIGDSGGVEATGYNSASAVLPNGNAVTATNYTSGFGVWSANATNAIYGSIVLNLTNASNNTWEASGNLTILGATLITTAGTKALSGTLDRIRLTTTNGTDTFDAGSVNLLLEG